MKSGTRQGGEGRPLSGVIFELRSKCRPEANVHQRKHQSKGQGDGQQGPGGVDEAERRSGAAMGPGKPGEGVWTSGEVQGYSNGVKTSIRAE